MREHLQADLETNQKECSRPIFHRIGFNDASIYLTNTHFYDARGWDHGKNSIGKYYLFNWFDYRAKAILGFELGDESPALGKAKLIGSFTPSNDDLKDVKYMSNSGKAYFKSALAELEGRVLADEKVIKIDSENFMKMKEIIPTGAQGKAIYGQGDYIIDGPAGTGKSTTVLQKIKLLEHQENIDPSRIKVVVKNSKVVPRFKELLQSINIEDVSILTAKNFLLENYPSELTVSTEKLVELNELTVTAVSLFDTVFNIQTIFSQGYKLDVSELRRLLTIADNNKAYDTQAKRFLERAKTIRETKVNNDKSIAQKHKDLKESVALQKEKLTAATIQRNKKSLTKRIIRLIGMNLSSSEDAMTLGDEADIRDQVNEYRTQKQASIDKIKIRLQDDRLKQEQHLIESKTELKQVFINAVCQNKSPFESDILFRYFNKYFFKNFDIHTVIIDEAQDISAVDIELIRLTSKNTILAGDESQTESLDGISLWENLAIATSFTKDGSLQLYQLRHNFRQTYELGSVSYNYRQLLLNRNIEDIRSDYFEDQIGFNKPSLKLISENKDFVSLLKSRISYIKETFSNAVPLVIFYENSQSLHRLKDVVRTEKLSFSTDENIDTNNDVLFVNILEIAGREFPVVLAPLAKSTKPNTIYIMLSRAKFDLTFFTGANNNIEEHVQTLCQKGLIQT
jgi:hypothetical protein